MSDFSVLLLAGLMVVAAPITIILYSVGSSWALQAGKKNHRRWGWLSVFFHLFVLAYLYVVKTWEHNERLLETHLRDLKVNIYTPPPKFKRNYLPYVILGTVVFTAGMRLVG
jgi:hypothetical protein